jgi:hypothetical protein
MCRSLAICAILVSSALGLACSNDPTSSRPSANPGPTFRTEQNPEGPGAFVVQLQSTLGFLFTFEDPALSVLTGLTLDQLDSLCSGGEFVIEPADVRVVFFPHQAGSRDVFKARDFTVLVFEGVFPDVDICAVPPFAVGEGDFNQESGTPFASRIDHILGTLRARVFEATGEEHHLLIRFQQRFDRATGEEELVSDINFN